GFNQIALAKDTADLFAFWTPFGRYRFNRLPFGVCSASEVFQYHLATVLEGLTGVLAIADDILVVGCGATKEEALKDHDAHLLELFERARKRNLKFNKEKL